MDIVRRMDSRAAQRALERLYGERADKQLWRYKALAKKFAERFGREDFKFFSAPGRTEILGNHTDHNGGRVLAGSINLDTIAAASPRGDGKITVNSEGFDREFCLELSELGPVYSEQGTTNGLIRGIAARFKQLGMNIGGFDACIMSDVLRGSGLSSSASVEVLICQIFSQFYNDGKVSVMDIAQISQYAENQYFGKPCGLMDQAAVCLGGLAYMDFEVPSEPKTAKLDFDFDKSGYALCLVKVGSDHADLTFEYAAIPDEMQAIAGEFGCKRLCEVDPAVFDAAVPQLREKYGDRAVLRAIHYWYENGLVDKRWEDLVAGDIESFLVHTRASGASSAMFLQNVSATVGDVREQHAMLALGLAERILDGRGAARIHGGGFGGSIQCFVPLDLVDEFIARMDTWLGEGSCRKYSITEEGACATWM